MKLLEYFKNSELSPLELKNYTLFYVNTHSEIKCMSIVQYIMSD